jgi:hypothetical protein
VVSFPPNIYQKFNTRYRATFHVVSCLKRSGNTGSSVTPNGLFADADMDAACSPPEELPLIAPVAPQTPHRQPSWGFRFELPSAGQKLAVRPLESGRPHKSLKARSARIFHSVTRGNKNHLLDSSFLSLVISVFDRLASANWAVRCLGRPRYAHLRHFCGVKRPASANMRKRPVDLFSTSARLAFAGEAEICTYREAVSTFEPMGKTRTCSMTAYCVLSSFASW